MNAIRKIEFVPGQGYYYDWVCTTDSEVFESQHFLNAIWGINISSTEVIIINDAGCIDMGFCREILAYYQKKENLDEPEPCVMEHRFFDKMVTVLVCGDTITGPISTVQLLFRAWLQRRMDANTLPVLRYPASFKYELFPWDRGFVEADIHIAEQAVTAMCILKMLLRRKNKKNPILSRELIRYLYKFL